MLIDWFTVGAQAINFLILVWLLKRLLYQPVLAAIDAREKKIAAQLADAAAQETRAQAERAEYQRRTADFEHERAALLHKAEDEATTERQRLLELAREDSQRLREKLNTALENERTELNLRFLTQAQQELFELARKVLTDLAGVSLEDRMVEVFSARLLQLGKRHDTGGTDGPITARSALVRSAFELSPAQHANIARAVREYLGADVSLQFEISAELVSGLELTVDGTKLAWSVGDYLSTLSRQVTELLAQPAAPLDTRHGH